MNSCLPNRIPTGNKNRTIPNPASLFQQQRGAKVYQGSASEYDFKRQSKNAAKLRQILIKNGTDFDCIAAARYKADDLCTNHRFVVTTTDNSLIWYKYVACSPLSGQNHVFVGGMRIKLRCFIEFDELTQSQLLSPRTFSVLAFDDLFRKRYDESSLLWS